MSSTATTYIENININFPIPGQDNDSQGFRNNWINISQALSSIDTQNTYLNKYAVLTTATTNTFYGNTISDVKLQNSSLELRDNGALTGDITIDYTAGNYQLLSLDAGSHSITVINWPAAGSAGELTLAISPSSTNVTTVNFVGSTSLGPSVNPYLLTSQTNIFELRSQYPLLATSNTVFVSLLNELIVGNTSTNIITANTLTLASPSGFFGNNQFSLSNSTGSIGATVVTGIYNAAPVAGNIAMVPNRITTNIVSGNWSSPSINSATQFGVASVNGILEGATFNVITTTTIQTVVNVYSTNSTIQCTPGFPDGIGTGSISFRNPTFTDVAENTAFPTLVTLTGTPANTSSGVAGVYQGSIYSNKNHLEVTFKDYGEGTTNTFVVDTLDVTTVTNNSTALANTEFVHQILPYGSIIMWYGTASQLPYGWNICDGTNGTPDLRNKFIIGASVDYSNTASTTITSTATVTGGRTDAILADHNHEIVDPGHSHNLTFETGTSGANPSGISNTGNSIQPVTTSFTGIFITGAVSSTATVVSNSSTITYANLPPYFALYYIMKTTGV